MLFGSTPERNLSLITPKSARFRNRYLPQRKCIMPTSSGCPRSAAIYGVSGRRILAWASPLRSVKTTTSPGANTAVSLAQTGRKVIVFEASDTIGGGTRSAQLTLPGFSHDVCSAVYALGAASPFFRELPLSDHGLEWIQPDIPLAHPFDDGSAAALHRSIEETAAEIQILLQKKKRRNVPS